jgi:hypothetical protein
MLSVESPSGKNVADQHTSNLETTYDIAIQHPVVESATPSHRLTGKNLGVIDGRIIPIQKDYSGMIHVIYDVWYDNTRKPTRLLDWTYHWG